MKNCLLEHSVCIREHMLFFGFYRCGWGKFIEKIILFSTRHYFVKEY